MTVVASFRSSNMPIDSVAETRDELAINQRRSVRRIAAACIGVRHDSMFLTHFFRFSLVGAIGIIVQLAALTFLHRVFGIHYLIAVGLAVESAILHNFVWHRVWTYADRRNKWLHEAGRTVGMFLRFNFTTGAISLAGNLIFTKALVGGLHLGLLRSNMISIVLCWILNFLASDLVVFT